ncbi:MAG TPA: hypothetical protein VM223_28765 [Planctomycetota bacterium]|nr:hypothetical protein [Planctomycetota bacterium]
MALSADTPLTLDEGIINGLPAAAAKLYEGSMLGLDADGYAAALLAGYQFLGHCFEQCDNSAGLAGDKKVKVRTGRYRAQVVLSGVSIVDIGRPVFASADGTCTLDATAPTNASNSLIGVVHRYVTTDTAIVEFRPGEDRLAGAEENKVVFFDDFLGYQALTSESGSAGPWLCVDVGDATEAIAADISGGAFALTIAATSEAEDAVLYMGDELNFAIALLETVTFRAKIGTPGTGVRIVAGMASDHALDKDSIAQNAWFSFDASLACKAESDDAVTDVDDQTVATLTTGLWYDFMIDFRDKTDIKFYLNGVRVAGTATFTMANYSGNLQPYFSADKASGTGTGSIVTDYVKIVSKRG